eukprot:4163127-Pleurochrysis_carterae.AAC.1
MSGSPVGVGEASEVACRVLVAQAKRFVVVEVHEDAPRRVHECRRRAAHGAAWEANGVHNVGSCLRRTVEQRANKRL